MVPPIVMGKAEGQLLPKNFTLANDDAFIHSVKSAPPHGGREVNRRCPTLAARMQCCRLLAMRSFIVPRLRFRAFQNLLSNLSVVGDEREKEQASCHDEAQLTNEKLHCTSQLLHTYLHIFLVFIH